MTNVSTEQRRTRKPPLQKGLAGGMELTGGKGEVEKLGSLRGRTPRGRTQRNFTPVQATTTATAWESPRGRGMARRLTE